MSHRKFLIVLGFGLMVTAFCWPTLRVAAQQNPYPLERQAARDALKQSMQERAKKDPLFKKYIDIYTKKNLALSQGKAKQSPQHTKGEGQ